MKTKTAVSTDFPIIKHAEHIEEILCMATLLATGKISATYISITEVNAYFEKIGSDCSNCEYAPKCLACVINE